jgi:outer membrane protein assembly factor BamD (BamD/ComL family)
MGAKQTRTGQQLLLFVAGFLIWSLAATGCLHWTPQPQGEKLLLEARKRFASGDYRSALDINQRVLAQFPASLADQSLFQIGLIYAHPRNSERDIQKAMDAFQGIIDSYPTSRLQPEAELWLTLLGELRAKEIQIQVLTQRDVSLQKTLKMQNQKIHQLQDQLEKFKRIDIKMEEKKRKTIPQAEELKEEGNGKNSGS